jgi:RNA polymerase sigma-70 factor (ECF subfamily)
VCSLLFFIFVLSDDDTETIRLLFESENTKMYSIALRILKSPEGAEEAVQEAFLRIADKIERIKQLPCPQRVPYCVVIVKNISKNMLRDRKPQVSIDDIDSMASDVDSDPEQEYFDSADNAHLVQTIRSLNEQDRNIILMRWGKKMKYSEIGKVLGITEETAKKRGQRALYELRAKYMEGFADAH